jgi:bifunctional non-homologous end joining protein LigD
MTRHRLSDFWRKPYAVCKVSGARPRPVLASSEIFSLGPPRDQVSDIRLAALFKACAERALEGIVSKHALAPYRSGRSRTWLKTKCFIESTFMVVGTDRDRKTGALMALLAHNDSAGLNYAGAAFITLGGDEWREFLAEVERLTTSWDVLKSSRATDVKWCQPRLMVRVRHLAGCKTLRHATVKGLET